MALLSWAPRWPLAAASRHEITEATLTSLSARATVMPSPNTPPNTHTITRSFTLQSSMLSAHPLPPTRPLRKLSQICQMMASSLLTAPRKLLDSLRHLHLKKKKKPPLSQSSTADGFTYCYPSAFALSASSWLVCFCLPHQRRSRGHGATGME